MSPPAGTTGSSPGAAPGMAAAAPSSAKAARLAVDLRAQIAALQEQNAAVVAAAQKAHAELLSKLVAQTARSIRDGEALERDTTAFLLGKAAAPASAPAAGNAVTPPARVS